MWAYVLRRLLFSIPTMIGVTILVFLVMRVAPGDVAVMMLGGDSGLVGRPEDLAKLRTELGLDRPLHIQYLSWMKDLVTFDFGSSYFYHAPMTELLKRKIPLSAEIGIFGILIGSTLGIAGGVIAALKQDTWVDYLIRTIAIAGISVPTFWSGMLVILVLIRVFQWIPEQGYTPLWEDPARNLAQLIWPILVIAFGFLMGVPLRMMRATMLEVLREDYIRTARAKGLSERVVLIRHA
ncbi:MAG: ABC transporter permease, partial [Chloroflexi bacterium]|nr:ABC transporter permease [Chloroflexota bacterium]